MSLSVALAGRQAHSPLLESYNFSWPLSSLVLIIYTYCLQWLWLGGGGAILMIAALRVLALSSLVATPLSGLWRSKNLWCVPLLKLSFGPLLLLFLSFVGFDTCSLNLVFRFICPSCSVTILVPLMFAQILGITLVWSMWKLTFILFVIRLRKVCCQLLMFPLRISSQMS